MMTSKCLRGMLSNKQASNQTVGWLGRSEHLGKSVLRCLSTEVLSTSTLIDLVEREIRIGCLAVHCSIASKAMM